MLLLSWGVVVAAELRCPAVTMVMDMRLARSLCRTVSAVLSRVGVEERVYTPSRLTSWHWALKRLPPAVTSHANAKVSHRPALTRMMNSVTTAIGIPCCPGLQRSSLPKSAYRLNNDRASLSNITRSVLCTAIGCLIRTQLNIFDLHNRSLLDDLGDFFFTKPQNSDSEFMRSEDRAHANTLSTVVMACRDDSKHFDFWDTQKRRSCPWELLGKGQTLSKHTWQVTGWTTCPSQANFN